MVSNINHQECTVVSSILDLTHYALITDTRVDLSFNRYFRTAVTYDGAANGESYQRYSSYQPGVNYRQSFPCYFQQHARGCDTVDDGNDCENFGYHTGKYKQRDPASDDKPGYERHWKFDTEGAVFWVLWVVVTNGRVLSAQSST